VQFFLLNTGEWQSDRFQRLCEYLEMDAEESEQITVRGHFSTFMCKWAQDMQTDSGLFFDVPVRRLGVWARSPNPEKFGNGLVHAGYVHPMDKKYPKEVLAGRSGLVYWGALDITWRSVHCDRVNKRDLVLFLADQDRRSRFALAMGIRPEEYPGWLLSEDQLKGGSGPDEATPPEESPRGRSGGPSAGASGGGGAGHPPAPPLPPRERSEKKETKFQRNVGGRKTGKPKTGEQRAIIAQCKYSDPARALLALDEEPLARGTWDAILQHDLGFVQTALSELVDTDQAWTGSTNPPGLIFSRCRGQLKWLNVDVTPYVQTYTERATPERGGGGMGFGA
jgi:hypothetical protein